MFDALMHKLQNSHYVTLETTPAHSPKFAPVIDKIAELGLEKYVDGFSTTDNPLAKLKYNALFAASMLQARFNKPVIATMSMRDRNRIALQSDLLGANEADVRAVLALTGDPAKISDQPHAKGVVEGDSTLLLDMISCFNSGIDYAGRPLTCKPEPIYPFAVMNAYAKNPRTLLKKMHKKMTHKAMGIITQPVYDLQTLQTLLQLRDEAREATESECELIVGLFPITKLRTAQFLASHVPGIDVPQAWLDTLRDAAAISEKAEFEAGFKLSKTLFDEVMAQHPKVHLMTANQFNVAKEILR